MLPPSLQKTHIPIGTRVLVRTSLNVPIEDGAVTGMFRLRSALPTIQFLRERKARITLVSHLSDDAASLRPVHRALNEMFPVSFMPHLTGEIPYAARKQMRPGEVLLLENVRTDPREKENDILFAEEIAAGADMFVFDDFTAAHRAHASTVGIIPHLPSYAGIRFYEELTALLRITERVTAPAVALMGGAKCATKLPLLEKLSARYDTIFVSGVLANTLLKHRGYEVGRSKTEEVAVPVPPADSPAVVLPRDFIVTKDFIEQRTVPADGVGPDDTIVDIGDRTLKAMAYRLPGARTVVMNGPTGWYEKGYMKQTVAIAGMIGESDAYSFAGGGDLVTALERGNRTDDFHFVSTGGGSLLQYLSGEELPVLTAFGERQNSESGTTVR